VELFFNDKTFWLHFLTYEILPLTVIWISSHSLVLMAFSYQLMFCVSLMFPTKIHFQNISGDDGSYS